MPFSARRERTTPRDPASLRSADPRQFPFPRPAVGLPGARHPRNGRLHRGRGDPAADRGNHPRGDSAQTPDAAVPSLPRRCAGRGGLPQVATLIAGVSAVVLAGGRSSRMGRDKAWPEVEGRPLVAWQADRLAGVFDDVRISAKDPRPFAAAGLRVIEDDAAEFAAVRGIRAALAELRRPVFVLAVDLPRFPAVLAGAIAESMLASGAACAAPVAGGYVHGLCAA